MSSSLGFAPVAESIEHARCPMGCPPDDRPVLSDRDRNYGTPGLFTVVTCARCGLVRTDPRPTPDAIKLCYPDHYGPHAARVEPRHRAPRENLWQRLLARLRLDGAGPLLPPVAPGVGVVALELGCATGGFLRKLRARGWEAFGIEPSPAAAAAARRAGFHVHVGTGEDRPVFDRRFNLVIASHALEHLHDPVLVLSHLRQQTRPGGWLACAVPDAGSWLARRFGAAWYDWDLPRHLFHFTRSTLAMVLARTGWQVRRVRGQASLSGLLGSAGHALAAQNGLRGRAGPRLLRFATEPSPIKPALEPLALALAAGNLTGRMIVWARAV